MAPLPDFTNSTLFPSFSALPLSNAPTNASAPSTHLLATIQQEMTISTSPTFICQDLSGQSFALTIRLPADEIDESLRGGGYDSKKWKKGHLALVKNARRSGIKEGKQGFVECRREDVVVIPAKMEKLVEIHGRNLIREEKFREFLGDQEATNIKGCQSCGCVKEEDRLKKCMGCECVWYCGRECQVKDWSEGGHKSECKVYHAFNSLNSS